METLIRMLDREEPPAEGDWMLEAAEEIGADCD